MKRHSRRFDFILDTVAAPHDLDAYLTLLKRDGTLCLVGVPDQPHPSPTVFNLILGRRQLTGSPIGGIKETQEMLDFCAERRLGRRGDPDPEGQRGVRADAQERREVSVRD